MQDFERLRRSEDRLSLALEIAHMSMWEWDILSGEIAYSDSFEPLLGVPPGTFGGTYEAFLAYVHPEDRQFVIRLSTRALDEGADYDIEFRIVRPDKTVRWVRAKGSISFDNTGVPVRLIGIVMNITDRKHLEDQLRQSQKMEVIGRLAGGVVHDLNNQMMVILGTVNLAIPELSPGHPVRSDLKEILSSGQRAIDLTSRLLAFSRQQIVEPQVLNLNDQLLNLDKMLPRLIGEDIELVILPEPNLGMVQMDPGQFEQVLANLAVNGRDAMPDGGKLIIKTANVTLDDEYARQHAGATPGKYVMLVVRDTGCGMTKEVKEHLFDPFFTTKDQDKGTGLGLSTCCGIVKQSSGHILVYSEPGRGSTFKIYLPCVEGTTDALPHSEGAGVLPRGTETVLLVEDEASVRKLVSRMLGKQGYTVFEASNGEEALHVAQEHTCKPIHLLLTDVVMPLMSSRKLVEHLAESRPEMKVLFISGYLDNSIVNHGVLDAGMPFLPKPFTPDVLACKVREVLDTSSRRILVVDDEQNASKILRDILKDQGFQVVTTSYNCQAVQEVGEGHFDLALLDIRIPQIDDLEIFEQIKSIDSDIKVIVMTAHPDTRLIQRALEYGGSAVIRKPLDSKKLVNLICRVLTCPGRISSMS